MAQEPDKQQPQPHPRQQDQPQDQQKKDSPLKNVAILSGIGIEMGVIIYLFVMLGKWLDANYNQGEKLYIIFCTLSGVAIALFVVVKQLNRIHK